MSRVREWAAAMLFPNRCCLCGEVITLDEHMCSRCAANAPYVLPPVCELCGRSTSDCTCGKRHRAYDRCVMPFYYEKQARTAIGTLKNQGDVSTVEGLALEMAELVRREYGGITFFCITPVPLHASDLRSRGFNQSALLGQSLSAVTGIPYVPLLTKIYHTPPQKELSSVRREANLLGVFDLVTQQNMTDKTVLLVDDLMTTGSTLNECAKMLKIGGAKEVYAITAAAAVLKNPADSV